MEFDFDIETIIPNTITLYEASSSKTMTDIQRVYEFDKRFENIINQMGIASAKSQGLNFPITSYSKFIHSTHKIYLLKETTLGINSKVVGLLRTGRKHLFLNNPAGKMHEMEPLSVLDFYVHESRQRSGQGRILFDFMLEREKRSPGEFAYDRPSHRLLAFLNKHYGLGNPIRQANNFAVFPIFFRKDISTHLNTVKYPKQHKMKSSIKTNNKTSSVKPGVDSLPPLSPTINNELISNDSEFPKNPDTYFPQFKLQRPKSRVTYSRHNSYSTDNERYKAIYGNNMNSWTVSTVYDKYFRQYSGSGLFN